MFKAYIFDVDGTLLDPSEGVIKSVQYTAKAFDLPQIPEEMIKRFIGPPIRDSMQAYYGLNDHEADQVTEIFRKRYKDVDLFCARVYDGIYHMMETLSRRNAILAVATYKRHDYAVQLLEHLHLDTYFTFIHGSDDDMKRTKIAILNRCIEDLGFADQCNIALIGDTAHDADAAQKAGIPFIGVTYGFGFHSDKDLSDYKYVGIADSVELLEELLKGAIDEEH